MHLDSSGVARLVELYLHASGQHQGRGNSPPFIERIPPHLDALSAQLLDGLGNVIAHQGELVTHPAIVCRTLGWVDPKLGGRQSENKPPVACVDVLEAKDVPEDVAQSFWLGGIEQRVGTNYAHRRIITRL